MVPSHSAFAWTASQEKPQSLMYALTACIREHNFIIRSEPLEMEMKPKSLWEGMSRIFESNERLDETENNRGTRYRRQIDSEYAHIEVTNNDNVTEEGSNRKNKDKSSKEIHFAFLPERYEPLTEDDEARERMKEEKRIKKKQKYKKYRKNVGKALRFSLRCLVAGLQSFTTGYSTPLSAAAAVIPELVPSRAHG
ncbi:required for drug-induced death protein 1-like [Anguilla rostrata]|uniref:required for drug-induced death protein 1-like n=1 Tax=Anguilla rostrata TaxID=7938 RepID=UPI0030CB9E4F